MYLTDNVPSLVVIGGTAAATAISLLLLTSAHIVVGEMLPGAVTGRGLIRTRSGRNSGWPTGSLQDPRIDAS